MISKSYAISKMKYYMDLKFISPAKLLFFYGIIGTIISFIIGIIATFIKCYDLERGICNINNDKFLENFYLYFTDLGTNTSNVIQELLIS
jgi:hypothetical protein